MIKSKIEWCTHTLNLITGCNAECPHCIARATALSYGGDQRRNMTETDKYHIEDGIIVTEEPLRAVNGHVKPYPFGFQPTYHRYNIGKILGKMRMGQNVYVSAMGELFGPWIPDWIIEEIFKECMKYPRNNYLFLTHYPYRYLKLQQEGKLPKLENFWYGSSFPNADSLLWAREGYHTFVNVEPLKEEFDTSECMESFDWVIIGAETGRHKNKVVPEMEWIRKIVVEADYHAKPVFMRDSLLQVVPEESMRRDIPKELDRKTISEKMEEQLMDACVICGKKGRKTDMTTIFAKVRRKGKSKRLAVMCRNCYVDWCRKLGIESFEEELYEETGMQKN